MSVAPEHVGFKDADELARGEAQVHAMDFGNGVRGPYVLFGCPRTGRVCGVPAKPSPPNSRGCAWDLTGDDLHPTLTPSVNCNSDAGCGWHGFVKDGRAE